MWKGGRAKDGDYWLVRIDGEYVREHRYVWEQANGPIPDGFVVHHLNGIKTDNRIENLFAISNAGHRHRERMVEAYEIRIRELETQQSPED